MGFPGIFGVFVKHIHGILVGELCLLALSPSLLPSPSVCVCHMNRTASTVPHTGSLGPAESLCYQLGQVKLIDHGSGLYHKLFASYGQLSTQDLCNEFLQVSLRVLTCAHNLT